MRKIFAAVLALALLALAGVAMAQVKPLEWKDTGSGAMSATFAPDGPWEVKQIDLHLSAAGGSSENFTITYDANAGAAYDMLLASYDMETETDYHSNEPRFGRSGDKLVFAWANSNSRTWGLRVLWVPRGK